MRSIRISYQWAYGINSKWVGPAGVPNGVSRRVVFRFIPIGTEYVHWDREELIVNESCVNTEQSHQQHHISTFKWSLNHLCKEKKLVSSINQSINQSNENLNRK